MMARLRATSPVRNLTPEADDLEAVLAMFDRGCYCGCIDGGECRCVNSVRCTHRGA